MTGACVRPRSSRGCSSSRASQRPSRANRAAISRAGKTSAFAGELDALRAAHRIPGLAAAVVRDRELVLAEGYGMAWLDDVESSPFARAFLDRVAFQVPGPAGRPKATATVLGIDP